MLLLALHQTRECITHNLDIIYPRLITQPHAPKPQSKNKALIPDEWSAHELLVEEVGHLQREALVARVLYPLSPTLCWLAHCTLSTRRVL